MLNRTLALFTFGVAAMLFGASQSEAQPGKGDKGPGFDADVQKLQRDLERLIEQVKEAKAKLDRVQGNKEGFEGKGKKGFDKEAMKKKFEEFARNKKGFDKEGMKKKFEEFAKGKGGFGPKGFEGKKGPGAKLDPATITAKYEFYKKLYDELPHGKGKGYEAKGKRGFGPKGFEGKKGPGGFNPKGPEGRKGPDSSASRGVEARIDRLIRELEEIRSEVRKKR